MEKMTSTYYLPPEHPEVTDGWTEGTVKARFAGPYVQGELTVDWREFPAFLHEGGMVAIYEYADCYTVHDVPSGYAIRNFISCRDAKQFAAGWLRLQADHPVIRGEEGIPASRQPEPIVGEVRAMLELIGRQQPEMEED